MIIDYLVNQVKEIPTKTDYWFVRTDDGKYFETFLKNGFIGIGWNEITLEEIKKGKSSNSLREKIIKSEKLDSSEPSTKGKVTTIINKLTNFVNLKKGDVIVIPSNSSSRLAFGVIEDSKIYLDIDKSNKCNFIKRKKVNWIVVKNMSELDPNFYTIKVSRHTISKVDDYSVFIDSVISSLFIKEDNAHFVLDIKTKKEINVNTLIALINNIQFLTKEINSKFLLGEEIDSNSIRLNLQSPGKIEFKLFSGKSLITLVALLSLTCCNESDDSTNTELDSFIATNKVVLEEINQAMDELEVDKQRINSFKYGN